MNDDNNNMTKFLRKFKSKTTSKYYTFMQPRIENVGMVLEKDNNVILPEPLYGQKEEIVFDIDFSDYNMK